MDELGLWIAALLAFGSALGGNRTATVLLCSLVYAKCLTWLSVPFSLGLWLVADLAVLAVVVHRNMTLQDEMIAALFVPAWWSYFRDPVMLYEVTMGVVILQLLLTVPWLKWQRSLFTYSHGPMRAGKVQEATNGGKH